jgi:hypothetical protein
MTLPRQAFVTICDDVRVETSGKLILIGVYPNHHLAIPTEPFGATQLVFNFYAESDITEPFTSVTLEVTLPKQPAQRFDMPMGIPSPPQPGWTRWFVRHPMVLRPAVLYFGRITTKVIHDKGETEATGGWVVPSTPIAEQERSA